MTFDQLDTSVLLFVLLTTHVGLFILTNLWFRKDMAICSKKMVVPNIALFILGNLWPLTWTVYLIYIACDWVTGRIRTGRIQALVDENNRLEEELAMSRQTVADLKESCASLNRNIREKTEELILLYQKRRAEETNSPTSLPPYTPDVWKAIRELQMKAEGQVSSAMLKRIFMIETYLAKWDGSGNWMAYLEYASSERAKNEAPEEASQDVACQERHD